MQFWTGSSRADLYPFCWPCSHKPSPKDLQLWQQALASSLNLGWVQQLPIPLGKWQQNICQANGCFMNDNGSQLYKRLDNEWFMFTPIPQWRCMQSFNLLAESMTEAMIPRNLHHASAYTWGNMITVMGHSLIKDLTANGGKKHSTNCGSSSRYWKERWWNSLVQLSQERWWWSVMDPSETSMVWLCGQLKEKIPLLSSGVQGSCQVCQKTRVCTRANSLGFGEFLIHYTSLPRIITSNLNPWWLPAMAFQH